MSTQEEMEGIAHHKQKCLLLQSAAQSEKTTQPTSKATLKEIGLRNSNPSAHSTRPSDI